MNKRLRNMLQNLLLTVLAVAAVFLMAQLPILQNIRWADRVQDLLSSRPASAGQEAEAAPAGMFSSVHLMVTQDSEYGRSGRLCVPADDPSLQPVLPLFREALGSAGQVESAAEASLRGALAGTGIFLDFTAGGSLPMSAAEVWLGGGAAFDRTVRAMALVPGQDAAAALYLLDGDGGIWLLQTALPASALESICDGFPPNGSCFAYETGYGSLDPYAVMVAEAGQLPQLQSGLPAGYFAYNLLTALDFNAHTLSRYTESDGTEVVEESPRTLRIGPDGTVSFSSREAAASPLYRTAGEEPGMADYIAAAWRLATALAEGTGASPVHLYAAELTETGGVLRFRYQAEGAPVYFSDEADALRVVFTGRNITSFSYRCRTYTPAEEMSEMLPVSMARAIAAIYPGAGLSVGYVDGGTGQLSAQWLPR